MDRDLEHAALVALLREGSRPCELYAELIEREGTAWPLLEEEHGLLAPALMDSAAADIGRWRTAGYRIVTVLDADYPENLRAVHDRPPLIFVAGRLQPEDARSVAVIGARNASPAGVALARDVAAHLCSMGFTVISGLARGIDTEAHLAALDAGGRTLAVVGTGLGRCYPPENSALQQQIMNRCAVVSQFWPDASPTRRSFPMRNAVMSGISLASVIVEASERSGARMQARRALAHGRPVLLMEGLLHQEWAQALADRPGVHVARSPNDVSEVVERLSSTAGLAG